MNSRPERFAAPEPSVVPEEGLHVGHYLYRFRRENVSQPLSPATVDAFRSALHPSSDASPSKLAVYWTSGHRADFAVFVMDRDPAVVDAVHQSLQSSTLGTIIEPTWSFVSISEISEYVPSVDQFRENLIAEGVDPADVEQRVAGYERRLPIMNKQRIEPEIPDWPAACFYPMNKIRDPHANWFATPFSARRKMMSEHAASGIEFAGRVSQLISVGVGLDDWEWMVTLWARNPQYLKDIVYRMRFDEASAKYAEFGPFYVGYKSDADGILRHCRLLPTDG